MAGTGRLAVFHGPEKPLEVREYPIPEVEPDAILVKITMANVCGSDMHIWRGDTDPGSDLTHGTSFGHEMTGRVAELGRNIASDSLGQPLKEGDQVVFSYFYPCNRCRVCVTGDLAACPNKGHIVCTPLDKPPYFTGSFGEYYYLRPGHFVYKVPEGLPEEVVASVNCAFSQVTYGFEKIGLQMGESVVIQGAGGLGVYACVVAKERGASPIIVVDGIKERLELAKEFGADEVVDMTEFPTHRDRIGHVKRLTGGLGPDVAAEFVGMPEVFNEGVSMLRPGGRYLAIGNISGGSITFIPARLVHVNKSVVGVGTYDPRVIPRVLDLLARTKDTYPYDRATSHKFSLDQVNEALNQSEWVGRKEDATHITRASIVP